MSIIARKSDFVACELQRSGPAFASAKPDQRLTSAHAITCANPESFFRGVQLSQFF